MLLLFIFKNQNKIKSVSVYNQDCEEATLNGYKEVSWYDERNDFMRGYQGKHKLIHGCIVDVDKYLIGQPSAKVIMLKNRRGGYGYIIDSISHFHNISFDNIDRFFKENYKFWLRNEKMKKLKNKVKNGQQTI